MRDFSIRNILFQVHLWTGLVLGIVFVALGLSGSVLVYHDEIEAMFAPVPRANTHGPALPLEWLISSARKASDAPRSASATVTLPEEQGDPAIVRFQQGRTNGPPSAGMIGQVYIDPVSGQVLGTRKGSMAPIMRFAHDLHGQLFLGREGRQLVGWMGVLMLLLGFSGIVLWWPGNSKWKYAFIVRRDATGLRFHRELHGATGIWFWIVFVVVSFTGVAIVFPQTIGAMSGGTSATTVDLRNGPKVTAIEGARRIGADQAMKIAKAAVPHGEVASLSIPARLDQAIRVSLRGAGMNHPITSTVFVDPWAGKVVAVRDPKSGSETFMAWQRPLHEGQFGPLWRFLVFLSGFLPLLFVITGVVMWVTKRANHRRLVEKVGGTGA